MKKPKIDHRGKWHNRTMDDCHHGRLEKAFAEAWEKENNPSSMLNYGVGTGVGLLCMEPSEMAITFGGFAQVRELTQEEATAMATAIQWLGSNCGFCFLSMVLEQCGYVVKRRAE